MKKFAFLFLTLNVGIVLFSLSGSYALFNGIEVPDWNYSALSYGLGIANIITGIIAAALLMGNAQGWKPTFLLLLCCAMIAGGSELLGTTTGYPFGRYEYTDRLGPKFLGHVPYLIPISWFMMLYPSLHLARQLSLPRWSLALGASAILTLWDVAMDPAVTTGYQYWVWNQSGEFYGMPFINWFGWLLTGWVVAQVFLWIHPSWKPDCSWMPTVLWFTQGVFVSGLALIYQRPLAALAWAVGAVLLLGAVFLRSRKALQTANASQRVKIASLSDR